MLFYLKTFVWNITRLNTLESEDYRFWYSWMKQIQLVMWQTILNKMHPDKWNIKQCTICKLTVSTALQFTLKKSSFINTHL